MAAPIRSLRVEGLFGYLNHDIHFRTQGVTILSGPNGSGKTHVLKILRALVALDLYGLLEYPFTSATLLLANHRALRVTQLEEGALLVEASAGEDEQLGQATLSTAELPDPKALEVPPWVERSGPDEWFDSRYQRFITDQEVVRHYSRHQVLPSLIEAHEWLGEFQTNRKRFQGRTNQLRLRAEPIFVL